MKGRPIPKPRSRHDAMNQMARILVEECKFDRSEAATLAAYGCPHHFHDVVSCMLLIRVVAHRMRELASEPGGIHPAPDFDTTYGWDHRATFWWFPTIGHRILPKE